MGNHLLDGGDESQNFENFQEYPSFDNGILDLETMSSEIMGAETVNPGSMNSGSMNPGNMSAETMNPGNMNPENMNNGILDIGTIDSGGMNAEAINSGIENPATINSGTTNSGTVSPGIMNPEFVNPETMSPRIMNPEFVNPETMSPGIMNPEFVNPEIPVQQTFDSGISDTSNNFEQAIVPGTIDSRSFTHTEVEWQKIQEGGATVDFVDATDTWDDYSEDKPRSFFRTLLAFFVSIIVAVVLALINVMLYDIEYISTMQFLMSMLPPAGMFTCFYYMINKRRMEVVEGMMLIVLNEIISYIMFQAVMAHNVQKIYPEISFQEAWRFVDVMKAISEMQRIYYLHFAIIFGVASLLGIAYGILGIKGLLDGVQGRRRRY